jgi:hypothetical protein
MRSQRLTAISELENLEQQWPRVAASIRTVCMSSRLQGLAATDTMTNDLNEVYSVIMLSRFGWTRSDHPNDQTLVRVIHHEFAHAVVNTLLLRADRWCLARLSGGRALWTAGAEAAGLHVPFPPDAELDEALTDQVAEGLLRPRARSHASGLRVVLRELWRERGSNVGRADSRRTAPIAS